MKVQEPIMIINIVESVIIKGPRRYTKGNNDKNVIGVDKVLFKIKREAANELIKCHSDYNTFIIQEAPKENDSVFIVKQSHLKDTSYAKYIDQYNAIQLMSNSLAAKMILSDYNVILFDDFISHYQDIPKEQLISEEELLSILLDKYLFINREDYYEQLEDMKSKIRNYIFKNN